MMQDEPGRDECLRRFLAPAHAVGDRRGWQAIGAADTPAADALCEIYLTIDGAVEQGCILDAAFAVYGPPVVVACADWLCERLAGRTIGSASGLSMQAMQTALALSAQQRYGAILVIDACKDALAQLKS